MSRTIVLRFDAVCFDCGATLAAGSSARWFGRGRVSCCGRGAPASKGAPSSAPPAPRRAAPIDSGDPFGFVDGPAPSSAPPAPAPAAPPADLRLEVDRLRAALEAADSARAALEAEVDRLRKGARSAGLELVRPADDLPESLREPDVSNWIRGAYRLARGRDPIDAARDAAILARILAADADRAIGL